MCFSLEASFASSAVITTIGIASIRQVKEPKQLLFASIPFIFGIHQFIEGVLWLSLLNPDYQYLEKYASYLFVIIAQLLWPIVIPLSLLLIEVNEKRKTWLKVILIISLMLLITNSISLFKFNVTVELLNYHIRYGLYFPHHMTLGIITFLLYILTTISPLYISSVKRMYQFALLTTASLFISFLFYTETIASIWCFFSAIISAIIYKIIKDLNQKTIKA